MQIFVQSPTDPDFVQTPYPAYDRARALGDVVFWQDYDMPAAVSHRAVSALLRNRKLGRAPVTPIAVPDHLQDFYAVEAHSMLELEPPTHTRLRGLVLRAFTSRRIAALEPEITELSQELIRALPRDAAFDLLTSFAQPLPVKIIARLLGVPESLSDQLLSWSNKMVAMYQSNRTRAVEDAANTAAREFSDFMRGYISERRDQPADDLITHLIRAEEDGEKLSTDELITTCILLLNAGHEATVHTIGNGTKALLEANHRQVDTPEIEEILRFDPPLHIFTRWAYEDVECFGTTLRAGTQVACVLGAANRDPAMFTDPHWFNPTRDASGHTAFGAGLHFCVGAPLARLEMRLGMQELFRQMPDLRIAQAPHYADTYHFHGLQRLMVQAS